MEYEFTSENHLVPLNQSLRQRVSLGTTASVPTENDSSTRPFKEARAHDKQHTTENKEAKFI